jgi:hypothetical protein
MPNLFVDGTLSAGTTAVPAGSTLVANNVVTTASNSGRDADSVTANNAGVIITTYSLTTLAESVYTLTVTNSLVTVGSMVFASVWNAGTSTNAAGIPTMAQVVPKAGAVDIKVLNSSNTSGGTAFNGTLKIGMLVFSS